MKIQEINQKKLLILTMLILILSTFSCFVYSENVNDEKKTKVIQFDTILELNASKIGTNILLFARYWVSEDFYSIGVRWAEPYIGVVNFPTYAPGFVINSDDKHFSMINKVAEVHNQTFSKPIGDRGIFRYSLNAYPMDNIRFAEKEALASRVYIKDFSNSPISDSNEWQSYVIPDKEEKNGIKRDVSKVNVMANNGNITKIALGDSEGLFLKGVDYEYSKKEGKYFLKKQTVIIPERKFMVGFNGEGAIITIKDRKIPIRDLPAIHHKGGRKCMVDYQTIQTDNGLISVPSDIYVHKANSISLLRTAKMSNFVQMEMTKEEAKQAAIDFGSLNEQDLKARELFEKCWLKNRKELEDKDISELEKLNKYFDENLSKAKIFADKLKNLGMLLKIDLILGIDNLQEHFTQYIDLLKKDSRDKMILFGGLNTIETAYKWNRPDDADMLLKTWLNSSALSCEPEEILNFSQYNIKRESFWEIFNLLERYLKSNKNIDQYKFDIQAVKTEALFRFYNAIKNPSEKISDKLKAQAAWAFKSTNIDDIQNTFKESLAQSLQSFSLLNEPGQNQTITKLKLEQMNKQVNQ